MAILVLAACPGPANAQVVDIAAAKSNLWVGGTNTYVAHDTQSYFTVRGRITSPFLSFTNETELFIQDTSAGIRVWSVPDIFVLETNSAVFAVGREVQVYGKISQDSGLRSIRPEWYDGDPTNSLYDFFLTDTNILPVSPALVTISNFIEQGEDLEGALIRINGVTAMDTNAWPYRDNSSITITDATGQIMLYVDKDTDVDGQFPPNTPFDIIGIARQYDTAAIPSNDYEIMPRYYSDMIQGIGQEPPTLWAPTNATAIVNAPLTFYIVGRDRNAGDTLTLTTNQAPAGSSFTELGNREGRFAWTPGTGDQGTTSIVIFSVTDGIATNTAETRIVVRPASGGPGYAWINEFHYDNDGDDAGEGVELAGEAGIDLSDYYLLLYNGGNGTHYQSNDCSGAIDDEGHGYGAVWFPMVPQNGSPDGIALVHVTQGLLQFLSYEGIFTAANGDAAGIASVDVGVSELFDTPIGQSLQLTGNGTNYEAFTWSGPAAASPGDLNGPGQIIIGDINAKVTYSGLALSPASPNTNQAFDIVCTITPNYTAENLAPTAYYSLDGGATNTIGMSAQGDNQWKTASTVPGQPNNTLVAYFIGAAFDGPGTNSPTFSVTNSHVVSDGSGPPGAIRFQGFEGLSSDTWEFMAYPNGATIATNSDRKNSGQASLRLTGSASLNADPYILFDNVLIFTYSNMQVSIAYSANGPDTGDDLYLDVSYDNGVTWNGTGSVKLVDGYGNCDIAFGETSPTNPATTDANPYVFDVPSTAAQIRLRARFDESAGNNNSADYYYIDDVALTGEGQAPSNLPPVLDSIPAQAVAISNTLEFAVRATEIDGDLVTLSASNLPANAAFYPTNGNGEANGTFVFTPDASQSGMVYGVQFWAVDEDGFDSNEVAITVTTPRSPFFWDFEDGWQDWTNYSRASARDWERRTTAGQGASGTTNYMYANGYGSADGLASDDWLISPALNLTTFGYPQLSFYAYVQYTGPDLTLRISTNYPGSGDPLAGGVSWTELSFTRPSAQTTWTLSGDVILEAYVQSNVYLAFHYTSTGTGSTQAALWEVDEIGIVQGDPNEPIVTITNPASGSVSNSVTTIDLSGTASTSVVGQLSWTNSLTGSSGSINAAASWLISGIGLNVGANVITVSGTNNAGDADSDSVTITRLSSSTPNDLDISGYQLVQTNAVQTFTFPADTVVSPGDYVVVARNADQSAFETFWGVSLGDNVVFLNSGGVCPQINGAEMYTLLDDEDALVDGPSGQPLTVGNTVQRTNTTADATLSSSWIMVSESLATPGTGALGDTTAGLVINEYSDATGTGNYIYEFVELYYDASATPGFVDTDGDGIDDNWEILHFGNLMTASSNTYNDADTASDLEEYYADTDPNDTNSVYNTATGFTNAPGGATMELIAGPPTTNSRIYDAWWNTNLIQGDWNAFDLDVPGRGDGAALTLTVTNDAPEERFYRTGVKVP
ncbi:MAG: lamin tail domain-containing protein [Kiritimatiellae bacterium]|nr:lamin tail domain-containing protein [Kiritimatiellia bacterium]